MRKKAVCFVILLVLLSVLSGCGETVQSKYESAQSLMANGQYAEAAAKFSELGNYEEATWMAMYCKAALAGENGDYDTALSGFRSLENY